MDGVITNREAKDLLTHYVANHFSHFCLAKEDHFPTVWLIKNERQWVLCLNNEWTQHCPLMVIEPSEILFLLPHLLKGKHPVKLSVYPQQGKLLEELKESIERSLVRGDKESFLALCQLYQLEHPSF